MVTLEFTIGTAVATILHISWLELIPFFASMALVVVGMGFLKNQDSTPVVASGVVVSLLEE